MGEEAKRWSAGMGVDDLCRACKELRRHTVIAADSSGAILRVVCDFCGSQHNFRGGTTRFTAQSARGEEPETRVTGVVRRVSPGGDSADEPGLGVVSERERSGPKMSAEGSDDLEMLLRRIIREEAGVTPVTPAEKWRGGTIVLKPGKPGLQDKTIPIDALFHKVVMIRNKLRVLEAQINGMEIPEDQKIKLQGYVTGCYGSLTTFNVLFAHEEDRFRGAASDE